MQLTPLEFSSGFAQYSHTLPWLRAAMDMARTFGLPAALLVIAVAANRLSRWTRVPDIIVLLLIQLGVPPALPGRLPKFDRSGSTPSLVVPRNFAAGTVCR